MRAKSIQGNSILEIDSILSSSIDDGFGPTLAIVFSAISIDRDEISSVFSEREIEIFGATAGKGFIDSGAEEASILVLLLEMDRNHFEILYCEKGQEEPRKEANILANKALASFSKPAFIVSASGFTIDGEKVLGGIKDAAGEEAIIYGGMAADDFKLEKAFVFTNNESSSSGIVLLAIDTAKYDVIGSAVCGWKPSGTIKTVTKSDGWWIQTIDDKPALDIVIKFLGIDVKQKNTIDLVDLNVMSSYPLHLHRKAGVPIMRPFSQINWETRAIKTDGIVEQGAKIQFSVPPDFDVIDEVLENCNKVKENELPEADAMIVFNCAGRLYTFGPLISKEIEGIHEIYNVPTAGFFTFGEFGQAKGGDHEYHNLTCSWVAIKEKG